jgi:hypothetical protein
MQVSDDHATVTAAQLTEDREPAEDGVLPLGCGAGVDLQTDGHQVNGLEQAVIERRHAVEEVVAASIVEDEGCDALVDDLGSAAIFYLVDDGIANPTPADKGPERW